MKIRLFNQTLNACRTRGALDPIKLATLPDETKTAMVYYLVRNRAPVITNLIHPGIDDAWLNAMGYLYQTQGADFTFRHTCSHTIAKRRTLPACLEVEEAAHWAARGVVTI